MGSTNTTRTHIPGDRGDSADGRLPSDGFSITPQDTGSSTPLVPLSVGVRGILPTVPVPTPMRIVLALAIAAAAGFFAWLIFAPMRGGPSPAAEIAEKVAGAVARRPGGRPEIPEIPMGMCGRDLGIFEVRVVSARRAKAYNGDPAIAVTIALKNTSKDRKILYRPHRGGGYFTMRDGLGNELRHLPKPPTDWNHGHPVRHQRFNIPLDPGDELTDEEFFDRPVGAAKTLRMLTPDDLAETPGSLGVTFGQHVFLIPSASIGPEGG